jgi:hypothetical protein
MKTSNSKPVKKTYHSPKVQIYGNIEQLTKSKGMTGSMDGAKGSNDKTRT